MQLSYATCPESQPIIHHFLCFSWGVPEMDWPNSSWSEFMRSGMPVQCRLNRWLSSPPLRGRMLLVAGHRNREDGFFYCFRPTRPSATVSGVDGRHRDLVPAPMRDRVEQVLEAFSMYDRLLTLRSVTTVGGAASLGYFCHSSYGGLAARPHLAKMQRYRCMRFAPQGCLGASVEIPSPAATHWDEDHGRHPGRSDIAYGRHTPQRGQARAQLPKKRQPSRPVRSCSSEQGVKSPTEI